jgi:hypothetical protein
MAKLTAQQATEKHARRLKASTQDIQIGVDRVTESPGKRAAAKADKMRTRLLEKLDDGTWARRVGAVTLEDWKTQMKTKGVGRIAAGIDAAAGKVTSFFEEFLPFLDGVKAEVDRMPDLTIEDSINRMTTQVRRTSQFRRK